MTTLSPIDHCSLANAQCPMPAPRPGTRGKYIAVQRMGLPLAILLPEQVQHCEAVNLHACAPTGAGFYWIDSSRHVHVEGESVSLKVKSRPQDAEAIENTLLLLGLL